MEAARNYVLNNWQALLGALIAFAVTLAVTYTIKRFLFRAWRGRAEKTQTVLDDILITALRGPATIWLLILALHVGLQSLPVSERAAALAARILLVLWVVSVTLVGSRLAGSLVKHYGRQLQGALPVTSLTEHVAKITVAIIGVLAVLNVFGVSVTPILTALGVGGLAVALALQDTLANLFAGFYVSLAGQVRIGDYIKLDSGEEGYVTDIAWRSTTMRSLPNNLIVIPNAKLAQAIVTNYHLPEKRISLPIPIGVSYDSDPDYIERVLVEEAGKAAGEIPGLLAEPQPFVRFIPGFGESSLNFTLICQVAEFVDQYPVQHELRKRILKRFRQEGIEIPFPIRTLYHRAASPTPAGS